MTDPLGSENMTPVSGHTDPDKLPASQVAQSTGFLPSGFLVPSVIWNDTYHVRPLRIEDADTDYDCYMSCVEYLRTGGFIQPSDTRFVDWPRHDQTRRWSTVLLGHAEYQLAAGQAVEYGIFNRDSSKEYGCLYIHPSHRRDYSASVTFWIRASHQDRLEADFLDFIREWIPQAYPFSGPIGLPGREVSWSEWLRPPSS